MVEQNEGPGAAVSFWAGVHVRLPRLWLEHLGFDALTCEHRLQPVRRLELVAGRISGVDRPILGQQGRRLTAHGTPLGVGAGHVRLEQPRRQEDRLRGRAEQADLWRRSHAGRARAGGREGQREERGATHESSGWKSEKDRKSTRLNSSHGYISYAVFCLKKKKNIKT